MEDRVCGETFKTITLGRVWDQLIGKMEEQAGSEPLPTYILKLLMKEHGLNYAEFSRRFPRFPKKGQDRTWRTWDQ